MILLDGVDVGSTRAHVGTSVTGPWSQVGAVKTLDGAGQATSDSYTPPATGTYYFYVSYSGDSNYLPSESARAHGTWGFARARSLKRD